MFILVLSPANWNIKQFVFGHKQCLLGSTWSTKLKRIQFVVPEYLLAWIFMNQFEHVSNVDMYRSTFAWFRIFNPGSNMPLPFSPKLCCSSISYYAPPATNLAFQYISSCPHLLKANRRSGILPWSWVQGQGRSRVLVYGKMCCSRSACWKKWYVPGQRVFLDSCNQIPLVTRPSTFQGTWCLLREYLLTSIFTYPLLHHTFLYLVMHICCTSIKL